MGTEGRALREDNGDERSTPQSAQALRVIAGERQAGQCLARLRDQQAGPDELAIVVSKLYGPALRGFCHTLEKHLRGAT